MTLRCRLFGCAYDVVHGAVPTIVCRRCRMRVVCIEGWWMDEANYQSYRVGVTTKTGVYR